MQIRYSFLLLLLFPGFLFGATLSIGNNGSFTTSGNATYTGLTMGNNSSLTVLSGHTLTINGAATSNNGLGITVQNGGTLIMTGCLTGNNNFNLNIAGDITLGCIDVDNNGSLTVQGTGNVTVTGNIVTGQNTTINVALNGELTVGGNVTIGTGTSSVAVNGTFHIEGQYSGPIPTSSSGNGNMDDQDQTFLPVLLPIVLKEMHMECTSKERTISWTTASEFNTSHFSVLSSEDGIVWDVLGSVQAAGYSDTEVQYDYTINAPRVNYMQVVQFDKNGVFVELGILSAFCQITEAFEISTYPNPSRDNFLVSLKGNEAVHSETSLIQIKDSFGRVLMTKNVELTDGSSIIPIEVNNLNKGIYTIVISNNSGLYKSCSHIVY
jgi:hypothetical protein